MIEPGAQVGRFRIERPLGQGAMGNVYLAIDPAIERAVAIKIVRMDLAGDDRREEVETRFLREAKIAGRLQHPNIVTIYDVGRDEGRTFIAMEYVDGRPLSRLLRPDVPLTHAQRFVIARQTAEALAHAHERQVIHRDVKPGNILIRNDGVVKVSDFGIGKLLGGGAADVTRTGMMVGSPSYMSPEQIRGDTLDGRSDIFSLGIVLYEMFTGSRPFPGESVTSLVYQILHTEPRDPLLVHPDLPPLTTEIVRRALAKKRDDRYPSARDLVRDLERAAATSSEHDHVPTSVVGPFPSPPPTPIPVSSGGSGGAATAAAAATVPASTSGSSPTVIVEKRGGAALLFGIAALVLAAAAFLFVVTQGRRGLVLPGLPGRNGTASSTASEHSTATSTPGPAAPASSTLAAATASANTVTATPAPTAASASTATIVPGPPSSASGSAEVGRPKENRRTTGGTDTATARIPASAPAMAPEGEPAGPVPPPAEETAVDNTYRTRRAMKFQLSPDQARLTIDGKYVGIADDWDDHGGGKTFPFSPGVHHVTAALPGYRDLNLQIVVSPSAGRDTESAGDELKRLSKEPFAKIPKVDYETEGDVFFDASLAAAHVLVDGHEAGLASTFTAAKPLHLTGPTMHDVLLTDGTRSKAIRVLASSTAGANRIVIKEKLK